MNYDDFITKKKTKFVASGFECGSLPDGLFDYQVDIVKWSCRLGKAAIFADTGLGKTAMQVAWADQVAQHTGKPVLILAPLCVAQQTVNEASKFGIDVRYLREPFESYPPIVITNYERVEKFDPNEFAGIVLDESSILKSHTSKTRQTLIAMFESTPYKLSCTATPSPNDFMELGNQAEFLGQMSQQEMLAMYFVHDGGETQKWRLKGHGQEKFWLWLATWSVFMSKPSDLGYENHGHDLPPLQFHEHSITTDNLIVGELFAKPVTDLSSRRAVKRESIEDRISEAASIINASDETWIVWCELNDESSYVAKKIPDSVEVYGGHSPDEKESRIMAFSDGDTRVLVTKPSIAGFGMNWQHCQHMAFISLTDSYEQLYQAIRRCWRYGQTMPVHVHLFFIDEESTVLANLKRKADQMETMKAAMRESVADLCSATLRGGVPNKTHYAATQQMEIPQWLVA